MRSSDHQSAHEPGVNLELNQWVQSSHLHSCSDLMSAEDSKLTTQLSDALNHCFYLRVAHVHLFNTIGDSLLLRHIQAMIGRVKHQGWSASSHLKTQNKWLLHRCHDLLSSRFALRSQQVTIGAHANYASHHESNSLRPWWISDSLRDIMASIDNQTQRKMPADNSRSSSSIGKDSVHRNKVPNWVHQAPIGHHHSQTKNFKSICFRVHSWTWVRASSRRSIIVKNATIIIKWVVTFNVG